MAEQWIVIPGWEKFQHRDAGRSGRGAIWTRDYVDQLHKDEYRDLPFYLRGLLKDLRHAYVSTQGQLRLDTKSLGRRFGQRVFTKHIERLVDAGFVVVSASRPPALIQQPAGLEVDVDVPPNPQKGGRAKPADNGIAAGAQGTRATTPDGHVCPHCGIVKAGPQALAEHVANVHYDAGAGEPPGELLERLDELLEPEAT